MSDVYEIHVFVICRLLRHSCSITCHATCPNCNFPRGFRIKIMNADLLSSCIEYDVFIAQVTCRRVAMLARFRNLRLDC
jgi:hypothetical protein